jgi:hypothetical protein
VVNDRAFCAPRVAVPGIGLLVSLVEPGALLDAAQEGASGTVH